MEEEDPYLHEREMRMLLQLIKEALLAASVHLDLLQWLMVMSFPPW